MLGTNEPDAIFNGVPEPPPPSEIASSVYSFAVETAVSTASLTASCVTYTTMLEVATGEPSGTSIVVAVAPVAAFVIALNL